MNSAEKIQAAYKFGYVAAQENRSRAPAMDKNCMSLIETSVIGSSIDLLKAFNSGYQDRYDEEAEAALVA
ncbi:hypothetical protein ACFQAT_28470 [Undibacterium arcticum]|uniref:Uncharacterized protein n=1 Tax=Undibacterium arcticum TaxID=1762892 RepID=A0ABV7F6Z0_9BURK